MRIKSLLLLIILLLFASLFGCAETNIQGIHDETFPEGAPIPLKVAVIYNGVDFYRGVDTNHDMGKLKYIFTLDTGKILAGLLQQRLPKIFSEVVFIPDIESLKPGYLPLIPKGLKVNTENGKLAKNFRCGFTTYSIKGTASYSLMLATSQGDPVVEYSSSDSQELADSWNAYCVGKRQVGGANDRDYLHLIEQAMKNIMVRIERDIRGSGTITLYSQLQESLPKDVLMDQWPHTVVLENANPSNDDLIREPEPFKAVAGRVQKYMDEYLAARSPDKIKLDIPQRIEPPMLPPFSEEQRNVAVQEETEDPENPVQPPLVLFPERRDLRILKLQGQFRRAVENRNQRLNNVKNEYIRELGIINNEQEAKKNLAERRYRSYVRIAMLDVMGGIRIKQSDYDSPSGRLLVTIEAVKADYKIQAGFAMTAQEASAVMRSGSPAVPVVEFSINEKGIRPLKAKLYNNGKSYEAVILAGDSSEIVFGTVFNYKTLSFTDQDAMVFAIQNPNLPDPSHISIIAPSYSEDSAAKSFTEDLLTIIRSIPPSPPSPDKWLVAIGIETYDEADRVLFGARSYTLFVEVAQRALRIPKDHVLGVLNEQATAQGISRVFAELMKKARAGDTIYLYYSGHIVKNPLNNRMFLLPKDMIPDTAISEGRFRIETLLDTLMTLKPSRIIAFLDAGTSGKTDGSPVMTGLQRVASFKPEFQIDPERVTLVTACRHDQSSNIFLEKRHRMFSYYLIRDLALNANSDLHSFLKKLADDVMESSLRRQDIYRQDPQIYGNTKGGL